MATKQKRPPGTVKNLADALQISRRRVSQLLAAGMPETPAEAIAWRQQRETGDDSAAALRRERILLVREQRQRAALENAERRGELVSATKVREDMTRLAANVRVELTRRFCNDLPPMLAGLDEVAIARVLRQALHEALTELSSEKSWIYRDCETAGV